MLELEKTKFKLKDKIGMGIILVALGLFLVQRILWGGGVVDGKEIMIDNVKLNVIVADNDEKRYQGLSGRSALGDNQGMLFVHNVVGQYKYVMRDMNFDLDFIFIKDGKIVDIAKNVSKDFKGIVQGATDYDMVLEVPAGWVERNGVELGDSVSR